MTDAGDACSAAEYVATALRRRTKFGNVPTARDGVVFHSAAEARRYDDLKLMLAAGEIAELELQPTYPIVVNGVRICSYSPDFRYRTRAGETVVEDVKGAIPRDFPLRKKLMLAVHGIEVRVVKA